MVLKAHLDVRRVVIELAWVCGSIVVLTLLAPFGALGDAFWGERLAYWGRTLLFGYALYRPLVLIAAGAAVRLDLPEWGGWLACLLLASVPMSIWLWFCGPQIDFARPGLGSAALLETMGQVVLVGLLVGGCLWFFPAGMDSDDRTPLEPVGPQTRPSALKPLGAGLEARLPHRLGRDIWALQSEDHYVRVHTPLGDDLVLVRMADAIADVASIDGVQIHRSWWVAYEAIARRETMGRQTYLVLKNGVRAPVARDRLRQLREGETQVGDAESMSDEA